MSDYFEGQDNKPKKAYRIDRCAWETKGKRCQMPGTIGLNPAGTGPHYCTWHFDMGVSAPGMARYSDDIEAFVSWIEGHRKFYDFPEHARRAGCDWCKYTLSSLWVALTKGVEDPLIPDPIATEFCKSAELGGGGGYDKAVAQDYSALINRILDRTVDNWRVELNTLNLKHGMEELNVEEHPPEPRRGWSNRSTKTREEKLAEAEELLQADAREG